MSEMETTVNSVVAAFCSQVVGEPLSFFSESDLQTVLSGMLRAAFPKDIRTSVKRGPVKDARSKKTYSTGLVHNEYGAEEQRRMDIVIFDEDDVKKIDDRRLRKEGKYLKPRFGFELGTESIKDVADHLKQDVAKLHGQVSTRGFVLHFFRDVSFADPGTKRRGKKEESIRANFRSHFEKCVRDEKLIVLAFVLRIGRMKTKIRGKCEMLDPTSGKWEKINAKKVEDAVLKLLSTPVKVICVSNP